jgi:hypothetical protein
MASTFTSGLRLETPGNGEQVGTWDVTMRANFDMIDKAVCGVYDIPIADAAIAISLTASGSPGSADPVINNIIRVVNASLLSNYALTIPAQNKTYTILNKTPRVMTVTTGAGVTATIAANTAAVCLSIASGTTAGVYILGPDSATIVAAAVAASTALMEANTKYIVATNAASAISYGSSSHRKYERLTNAGAIAVTMLAPTAPYGDVVTLEKATGAGNITISGDTGVTVSLTAGGSNVVSTVGKAVSVISINATTWKLIA